MKLEKIKTKTLRQKAYDLLKEKMITAEILPGEHITLRDLASRLGVSLMPVREALLQLQSEKVVVIESNKNMRVNNLSLKEMQEILRIRLTLETMAVERACDYRTNTVLAELARLLDDMEALMETRKKYLKKNRRFHFIIYKSARSPILFEIISSLWTRVGPYIYLHTTDLNNVQTVMTYHRQLYAAIRDRDKSLAAWALYHDLCVAAKGMMRSVTRSNQDFDMPVFEKSTDATGAASTAPSRLSPSFPFESEHPTAPHE